MSQQKHGPEFKPVTECTRCKGFKKDGSQCTRRTCKTADFCWQHTAAEYGVRVKRSGIPGAGSGLFAAKDFRKGATVVPYAGKIRNMSLQEARATDNQYLLQAKPGQYIDARSTQSSLGRYANWCKPENKEKKQCKGANARLTNPSIKPGRRRPTGSIKVKPRGSGVKKGQEFFVSYGGSYGRG